jgi:hypothetical protein
VTRAVGQIGGWLAGPSELVFMAPLNAAALLVLFRMLLRKSADPWLRLTAGATLAQQTVGIFYAPAGRYYYLTWLLTLLVVVVWLHEEGLPAFRRTFPAISRSFAVHPLARAALRWLGGVAAILDLRSSRDPTPSFLPGTTAESRNP